MIRLSIPEIGLSLDVRRDLLKEMYEIGKEHFPLEFGGLLLGNYSNNFNHLTINETLIPIKYKSSKVNFERSTEGLEATLKDKYHKQPSQIYVGEWHTHPNNKAKPSTTDVLSIEAIANSKECFLKNPVLLIIGYNDSDVEFAFYVFFNNKLYKYE